MARRLQWGRGGEAAESYSIRSPTWPSGSLQWGRGGEAAERHARPAHVPGAPSCFNGAAAVRPRKVPTPAITKLAQIASMGPRR